MIQIQSFFEVQFPPSNGKRSTQAEAKVLYQDLVDVAKTIKAQKHLIFLDKQFLQASRSQFEVLPSCLTKVLAWILPSYRPRT